MVKASTLPRALVLVAVSTLMAGCAGKASDHPIGWQREVVAGQVQWTHGTQSYERRTMPFSESPRDLSTQEALGVIIRHPGAHLLATVPYPPCPGMAGVLKFRLPGSSAQLLDLGFVVRGRHAILVEYRRPSGTPFAAAVKRAFTSVLCRAPL
ncbi:MAG: hypothetical protein ACYDA5_11655 [Vulcanimicrobiaceae bacterium]